MNLDIRPREVVILSGVRTAFGTMGGTLKKMNATDLGVASAGPAIERAGITPEDVDHVIYGNVLQTANDAIYMARHFAHIEPFTDLAAWYERVTARPAFAASLPPQGAPRLYTRDFYPPWETRPDG